MNTRSFATMIAGMLLPPAVMAGGLGILKPSARYAVSAPLTPSLTPPSAGHAMLQAPDGITRASARAQLYGICISSGNIPALTPTIRTFRAGYSPTPQQVAELTPMSGVAGTRTGTELGYMEYDVNSQGALKSVTWTRLSLSDYTVTLSESQSYGLGVCMDMTTDPTTGTIYGISAIADYLVKIDPDSGEAEVVAPTKPFYAIAADASGQLYGILLDSATREGVLYTINKVTGAALRVGATGAKMLTDESGTSAYFQTASFSSANGQLYWCMVNAENASGLYSVDPATGQATYMAPFPDNETFVSLFDIPTPSSDAVPATVSDATAVIAPTSTPDDPKVEVSFKVPSHTVGGAEIDLIERVDIYRGAAAEAVYTEEYPDPGTVIRYTDTAPQPGFNAYRIVAVNAEGESLPTYVSIFVGHDYPEAPTAVEVHTDVDGYPVISWEAPVKGLKGLDIDPSILTYTVMRDINGISERIAEGVEDTYFTDTTIPLDHQAYPYYTVVASSPAGEGKASLAAGCYTGPAYTLPFEESFNDCLLSTSPWIMQSLDLGGRWELNYISTFPGSGPYDDSGMLVFIGFQSVDGAQARIATPKLDFSEVKNPLLSFYFYYLDMSDQDLRFDDHMTIEASISGGEYEMIPGADYYQHDANSRWTEVRLPLDTLAGQGDVSIGFHGHSAGGFDLLLDCIRILDSPNDSGVPTSSPFDAVKHNYTDLLGRPLIHPHGLCIRINPDGTATKLLLP